MQFQVNFRQIHHLWDISRNCVDFFFESMQFINETFGFLLMYEIGFRSINGSLCIRMIFLTVLKYPCLQAGSTAPVQ